MRLAMLLSLVIVSSALASEPVTIEVKLTPDQAAAVNAVIALAALQGQTVTPTQVVQGAVDRYLASVHDESIKERLRRKVLEEKLHDYYRRLDAEIAKAEKQAKAKP